MGACLVTILLKLTLKLILGLVVQFILGKNVFVVASLVIVFHYYLHWYIPYSSNTVTIGDFEILSYEMFLDFWLPVLLVSSLPYLSVWALAQVSPIVQLLSSRDATFFRIPSVNLMWVLLFSRKSSVNVLSLKSLLFSGFPINPIILSMLAKWRIALYLFHTLISPIDLKPSSSILPSILIFILLYFLRHIL